MINYNMEDFLMLNIKNISKNYKQKSVLKNINLTLSKGNSIAILGENGAGKTTFIKIMLGLLRPTTGIITYYGKNINKLRQEYLNAVGVVLEGNRNIYWYLSPWENLYYFGRLLGIDEKKIKSRGKELLKLFDLDKVENCKVSTFSRGMKQKVAIVIALLNNPKILFLDEPTLGLDVITKNKLIECLINIKKRGTIIVLTTHQLEIVDKIAEQIYFLKDGSLIKKDSKDIFEFLNNSIIQINLKNRKILNIVDGSHIQNLISFLIENNEIVEVVQKRKQTLEEFFLEIYKEKEKCIN